MPFWTLFWLIVPAVALLTVGTWISLGADRHADTDADPDEDEPTR